MILPEDKWFYFVNGRRAPSIEELKAGLEDMTEADFRYHVNNEKNDFANWVEGVFGEAKLARSLREVSERDGMIIILDDFLSEKSKPATPELPALAVEKIERPKPVKKVVIPEERKLSLEPDKELSEKEIKALVDEAAHIFDKEKNFEREKKFQEKEFRKEDEADKSERVYNEYAEKYAPSYGAEKPRHVEGSQRFIVREFIYGFTIGLIFGLIMLGIILNLKLA